MNWFQSLYFPAAMELHPEIKGVTASVLTSLRLLVASAMVGLTSKMYNATIYLVCGAMLVALGIAVPMVLVYERREWATASPLP